MDKQGISAITMILGLTLVATVLTTGMGLLSYLENAASFSRSKAQEAFWVAESGIYDAMYRLSLNYSFTAASSTLTVGLNQATVTVEKDQPSTGFSRIISIGAAGQARRRIEMSIFRDDLTGKLTIFSWQEVSL